MELMDRMNNSCSGTHSIQFVLCLRAMGTEAVLLSLYDLKHWMVNTATVIKSDDFSQYDASHSFQISLNYLWISVIKSVTVVWYLSCNIL